MPLDVEVIDIGTVTFMVNVPKHELLSEEEMSEIGREVEREFIAASERRELDNLITVVSTQVVRGCVTITLTLGGAVAAVGAAAVATAVVKASLSFVKDYKSLREGALLIAKDVGECWIKIKKWTKKLRVWFYREDLKTPDEAHTELKHKTTSRSKRKR